MKKPLCMGDLWPMCKIFIERPARLSVISRYKGKTLKISCGFYLKSGIKFKPRNDLDISYFDENNEFQS